MQRETEMCDRQNFYEDQDIVQEENHTYQYKYFAKQSSNAQVNQLQLLKAICGMLNGFGGYIFLGIKQDQSENNIRRIVLGYALTEWDKEQYKKYINNLAKKFYPKVDPADMDIYVKYVPVVCARQKKFVIKIVVRRGLDNYFYSFKHRYPELPIDVNVFIRRRDCESIQITDMAQIYQEILKRRDLKVSERAPIQTSKIVESGYWISKKTQEFVKIIENQKAQLDQSQIFDVMPEQFDSSDSNPSLEIAIDPMLKSYRRTVIENIPLTSQEEFKKKLRQFKRESIQRMPGKKEVTYIIKFSAYSQHLRFSQEFTEHPLANSNITVRLE